MLDIEEILKAEDEAIRKTGGCLAVSKEFLNERERNRQSADPVAAKKTGKAESERNGKSPEADRE